MHLPCNAGHDQPWLSFIYHVPSLTWDVAVRRANCFSQALGVAVTSYMASLSDGGPAWSNGGLWARHGYLITFEGLLS
jgi:hypothetical protein